MSPNYDIENGADFRLRRSIACHSVLRSPFLPFRMKPETVVALLPVKAAVLTVPSSFLLDSLQLSSFPHVQLLLSGDALSLVLLVGNLFFP